MLGHVYGAVYAPQDRFVESFSRRRLERVLRRAGRQSTPETRRTYHDSWTVAVLANLGLSTQLAALGVCLVLGTPRVYLWLTFAAFALLPFLQIRREAVSLRALAS
jgi:archaetidylinositol phosphate synthase